jgi:hypothetical protein
MQTNIHKSRSITSTRKHNQVTRMSECELAKIISSVDKKLVEGGRAGTNYRGTAVQEGARGLAMLRVFLYFIVISLFVDCTD